MNRKDIKGNDFVIFYYYDCLGVGKTEERGSDSDTIVKIIMAIDHYGKPTRMGWTRNGGIDTYLFMRYDRLQSMNIDDLLNEI